VEGQEADELKRTWRDAMLALGQMQPKIDGHESARKAAEF
jgi:hypothetical protein